MRITVLILMISVLPFMTNDTDHDTDGDTDDDTDDDINDDTDMVGVGTCILSKFQGKVGVPKIGLQFLICG